MLAYSIGVSQLDTTINLQSLNFAVAVNFLLPSGSSQIKSLSTLAKTHMLSTFSSTTSIADKTTLLTKVPRYHAGKALNIKRLLLHGVCGLSTT